LRINEKGKMERPKSKRARPKPPPARKENPRLQRLEHEDFLTGSIGAPGLGAEPGRVTVEKQNLGERIHEAREMRGLTLEDLSSRTGMSVDRLERVESNRTAPPLGELVRLGKALAMKMGYFISGGGDKPMCVVRADARPRVARRGKRVAEQYGYVYESLAAEKANRFMEPFLVTLMPTEFGELSSHDGQEFLFVLEGEIRAQVGKEVEVLHPGDSIYYDSSEPHLIKCYGKKAAKIVAVIHAAGR
jgi:quercetin dioxygenase-like cupin family protein/ribosome-binding protein aMBF1 (putative translation factor)